jgi:hypothetical protein
MTTIKNVNYTAEQTAELVAAYVAAPNAETVAKFAEKFAKGSKSIIAKLVREGCYVKAERLTKNGQKVEAKGEIADAIGKVLNLSEADVSSLEKANKSCLQAIFSALANSKPIGD